MAAVLTQDEEQPREAPPGHPPCSARRRLLLLREGPLRRDGEKKGKKEKILLIIFEKAETPPLAGAAQAAKALRCGVPGRRDGEECVGVWGGGGGGAAGEMPRSCWRRPRRGTGRTRGGGLGSPCPALPGDPPGLPALPGRVPGAKREEGSPRCSEFRSKASGCLARSFGEPRAAVLGPQGKKQSRQPAVGSLSTPELLRRFSPSPVTRLCDCKNLGVFCLSPRALRALQHQVGRGEHVQIFAAPRRKKSPKSSSVVAGNWSLRIFFFCEMPKGQQLFGARGLTRLH